MAVQSTNADTFPTAAPLDPRIAPAGTGGVRLRMDPTRGQHGALDGAWWPYTNDLVAELPALVAGVDAWLTGRSPGHSEHVSRVAVARDEWGEIPERTEVGGRRVRVAWFRSIDVHTVSVSCPNGAIYDLLVIPPDALNDAASAAMATAADPGNALGGSEILRPIGQDPVSLPVDSWHDPGFGLHPEWETDGGSITGEPAWLRDPSGIASMNPLPRSEHVD
ncbi:DUF5994 family protein [Actinocatenispora comari]|uniref:Uncharacterized protein n=1 Tax=Actinocatenispora comari TaxID=2807577 RepID=A0A8J4AGJ8_9ACTN|nr:DUF5994 family protein [Actinocatenispora comari]GIL30901.1 hypothetical protein NUM_61550 [Actinocatenispora comari]